MYRLIYKSSASIEVTWECIRKILNTSMENNKESGVGGVLLATETQFLQVLEGSFESVNETFMRLSKDARHRHVQLIAFHSVDKQLFEGWGMRGIGVIGVNEDIKAQLIPKYGEFEGGVDFPMEEWRVLAMLQDIKMIDSLKILE